MRDHGCSHLVYGYEHFDDRILKTMGKGSTRKTNLRSFFGLLSLGLDLYLTKSLVFQRKILNH